MRDIRRLLGRGEPDIEAEIKELPEYMQLRVRYLQRIAPRILPYIPNLDDGTLIFSLDQTALEYGRAVEDYLKQNGISNARHIGVLDISKKEGRRIRRTEYSGVSQIFVQSRYDQSVVDRLTKMSRNPIERRENKLWIYIGGSMEDAQFSPILNGNQSYVQRAMQEVKR